MYITENIRIEGEEEEEEEKKLDKSNKIKRRDVYKRQLRHWPVSYDVYFMRIHANTCCRNQMAQILYFLLE